MPLPAVLGVAFAWLLKQAALIAVWFGVTWFLVDSDFGVQIVHRWLRDMNWHVGILTVPEWQEAWEAPVCAANAWVPIAESWLLFKTFWAASVSGLAVKWTHQLMKK